MSRNGTQPGNLALSLIGVLTPIAFLLGYASVRMISWRVAEVLIITLLAFDALAFVLIRRAERRHEKKVAAWRRKILPAAPETRSYMSKGSSILMLAFIPLFLFALKHWAAEGKWFLPLSLGLMVAGCIYFPLPKRRDRW